MIEFTESFYGREKPELKRWVLPGELPGIANRCLAAYRRLLKEGKFIQPTSGLVLLGKVRAAATPYAAFMDTYWEPDPIGEGTLIGVFEQTFREWAIQNEAYGIADTSTSNLIQEINKVPEWGWLASYRPAEIAKRPDLMFGRLSFRLPLSSQAILRASSFDSNFAADRLPGSHS